MLQNYDIEHIALLSIKEQCLLLCGTMHVILHCLVSTLSSKTLICLYSYLGSLNLWSLLVK